jgi:predicted RNA-binding Zn-ribbon protein involved in translation (DUF1610 family)
MANDVIKPCYRCGREVKVPKDKGSAICPACGAQNSTRKK